MCGNKDPIAVCYEEVMQQLDNRRIIVDDEHCLSTWICYRAHNSPLPSCSHCNACRSVTRAVGDMDTKPVTIYLSFVDIIGGSSLIPGRYPVIRAVACATQ